MYLLAIETTGAFASVALLEDDCVLEHIQGHDRFSHLQNLMPQVKEVLENHKLSINDVSAIAVSKGPGSFTGIRIGVSSTRALCQVLGVPGVPVSSLEALAMRVADLPGEKRRSTGDTLDDRTWICPILDARRSQVYGGGYVLQNGYPIEAFKGGAYTVEDFLEKTDECDRILLLGDGTDAYGEKIAEARREKGKFTEFAPESIRYQDAVTVGRLGAKLLQEGKGLSYQELLPDYMRQAEAERKLAEKQAAEAAKQAASKKWETNMADVLIRQANINDVDAIFEIEHLCFPDPWSKDSLRYELGENPRAFYIVAEIDGSVVGYAGLWWIEDEGHITNVAVRPGYRSRKIASGIVSVMIDFTTKQGIRHHTLEVRRSNAPAIGLYEKYGFTVEGVRKGYYLNNGEDALIMWRHEPESCDE